MSLPDYHTTRSGRYLASKSGADHHCCLPLALSVISQPRILADQSTWPIEYKKAVWRWYKVIRGPAGFSFNFFYFYLPRTFITWSNQLQALKARKLWHFYFIVLVKYSRTFNERPLQGTSSLASRLNTVSLDYYSTACI